MRTLPELVSLNRLGGAPCPDDLLVLLTDGIALLQELGVEVSGDVSWRPWADKSYLTESDLADPDIAANALAIDDTFEHIDFIAMVEDEDTYIGYWRGPQKAPLQNCPLVSYDSEGQFSLCGGRFVESLFFLVFDDEAIDHFREVCRDLGLVIAFDSIDDIVIPVIAPDPKAFHLARYLAHKSV